MIFIDDHGDRINVQGHHVLVWMVVRDANKHDSHVRDYRMLTAGAE